MTTIKRSLATPARETRNRIVYRDATRSDRVPADDLARARRYWEALLDVSLDERRESEGQGLQTRDARSSLGLHERGRGPGDRFSLPYFRVPDLAQALERLVELGGSVVHPGERWVICRDSEAARSGSVLS